jgi:hypothetical protein
MSSALNFFPNEAKIVENTEEFHLCPKVNHGVHGTDVQYNNIWPTEFNEDLVYCIALISVNKYGIH